MAAPHISLDDEKRALRRRQRALRERPGASALAGLESRIRAAIGADIAGRRIAAFLPIGSEPDLRGLLGALHGEGAPILLPVTPDQAGALSFRCWQPGCTMQPGRFGTQIPDGPPGVPELVLVPLLAFDADLHRLGYGGGFYDRTLAELPDARAIGVALEALRVDKVPVGPHDVPLDAVATELRVWRRA